MVEHHLDYDGSATPEPSYLLITTEVDFLRQATSGAPLLIRGAALCEWAERFFAGRNLPFRTVKSPLVEIREAIAPIDDEQATALVVRLGARLAGLPRPLSASSILQTLYPHRAWSELPAPPHAAWWLKWLSTSEPAPDLAPLLTATAAKWRQEAESTALELVYSAADAASAKLLLKQWLGVVPPGPLAALGEYPDAVPAWIVTEVAGEWRQALITTHGATIRELVQLGVPSALQLELAELATNYFERHPQDASSSLYAALEPTLSPQQQERLLRFVPPPRPKIMPTAAQDVLVWYVHEYLPYRSWQHAYGDADAAQTANAAAQSFALWYLAQYPLALLGGDMQPHLSFHHTRALQQGRTSYVTLLIVLDGLLWRDAQLVSSELKKYPRLRILEDGLAFAPLPTVTEFCKDALFKGLKPALAPDAPAIGKIVPESRSPHETMKNAQPGEVYLWRVMEPDNTYHKRNSYASLKNDIDARLQAIAKNIGELVEAIDASLPLRIVITSDHGRLLGTTERTYGVPAAMQAHGRAAWGDARRPFPATGFVIENDIVYLNRDRFGLREDAAVALSEDAFETNDGKGGSERYPHGGLYPEEVIVPWMALARDYEAPQAQVRCTGKATAQTSAALTVSVANLSEVALVATRLVLASETGYVLEFNLDAACPPVYQTTFSVTLTSWPTPAEAAAMSAHVTLRSPDRRTTEVKALVAIESEEMYSSSNILEGLDL